MKAAKWSAMDAGGAAVLLALLVIFHYGALRPALGSHQEMDAQRQQMSVLQRQASSAAAELETANVQLERLRLAVAENPIKLESPAAINSRLAKITELAAGNRLDISDIRPGNAVNAGRYATILISLSGTGRFRDCVYYVHQLHEQLPDTAVTGMKLVGGTGQSNQPATFQLTLNWYAAADAQGTINSVQH